MKQNKNFRIKFKIHFKALINKFKSIRVKVSIKHNPKVCIVKFVE